jgi:transcriptional regulator with XRE-family HTH domain
MPSVGEELRRERELRSISLEEIAEETKIGIRFLEAIDADRMDVIPGEFYRRASLKAYAQYLGLDADRILATYEFKSAADRVSPQLSQGEPSQGKDQAGNRATKWLVLIVAVLGLSGAAMMVWPVVGTPGAAPPPQATPSEEANSKVVADPASTVILNEPARTTGPVVRDEIDEVPAEALPLRLLIKVDEPCWLEVQADGEIAAQGLMLRGFEKEIQAEGELRLWLGNAGGVSIWLNERPGVSLGRPGQVRKDVLITPENLEKFVASEETDVVSVSEGTSGS